MRGLQHDVHSGPADLGRSAAHHAGQPDRAGGVGDHHVVGVQRAVHSVEHGEPLSRTRTPNDDVAGEQRAVVGVHRLAGFEHHVVRDVDSQRDRPHAGMHEPAGQPGRRRRGAVKAGHRQQAQQVAARDILDRRRPARLVRRRCADAGGITELDVECVRRLPRHAAHRVGVAAVGRDVEVEDVVAQAEHVDRVRTDLGRRRQHHDCAVLVAERELTGRADHAVADVSVGLAGADLEAARQDGPGQAHDDVVADREVDCATDDPAWRRFADVDLAVADRLLELRQLLDLQHLPDDERTGHVATRAMQPFELEAERDQPRTEVFCGDIRGELDIVAQPGGTDAHQGSPRNDSEKRTSPSNMSCMSSIPLRNISERSIPMPKANPL